MTFQVLVSQRSGLKTDIGKGYLQTARQLGVDGLTSCEVSRLYFVKGGCDQAGVERLAAELLADPVTETFEVTKDLSGFWSPDRSSGVTSIEVTLLPGVTDPAAENLIRSAEVIGVSLEQAATGERFTVGSNEELTDKQLQILTDKVFSNPVVQQSAVNRPIVPPFFDDAEPNDLVETVPLTKANNDELLSISQERRLSMNLQEMQAVQAWYQSEKREPTDIELEMLAQTWSEHCVHKTFRAVIDYTGPDGETEQIDGILKTYLRGATDAVDKPWVKSAFVDNAGIVAFTDEFDLAFKVETHNHPSALDPFGGANTGVGGCIRDVIGVSARPIANTDVLCFGPQEMAAEDLPEGVLHPALVQQGVVDGVEDYGNKMGIPTVNGAIVYHPGYMANPLVYVGCLGILPVGSHRTKAEAGDLIVALGGRTGRDGLRGATFSSMEMDVSTGEIAGTSVQIGHPIMEKQTLEVILQARDEALYTAITDCGAGGFSSAVGEMSEELGATIQLKNIPLKYPGLRPWEIWLSEAQERMVLAVPPENLDRVRELATGQNVETTILGTFSGDGRLKIFYGDELVGDLAEAFLHDGIPQRHMTAVWERDEKRIENREKRGGRGEMPDSGQTPLEQSSEGNSPDYGDILLKLLSHPNIRSREETIRLYDHEVQGGTAVKPLVGVANNGPSDGAVLVPLDSQLADPTNTKAVALSNGVCPQLTAIDPYHMAWAAIDEAVRNGVAVGADPDQMAILDNFCWGNPTLPDRLGSLVRCAQGCYDAAVAYGTPYISGKDSLYNEYTGADGEKYAIPGTLLISAMGIVPDVNRSVTMDFKAADEVVYLLGTTGDHLAGSHWQMVTGGEADEGPQAAEGLLDGYRAIHKGMQAGLISACHDCSEGGLAVALAEMALAGDFGADVDLTKVLTDEELPTDAVLFAESIGRLVMTVRVEHVTAFEAVMAGVAVAKIGRTTATGRLKVSDQIDLALSELTTAFCGKVVHAGGDGSVSSLTLQNETISRSRRPVQGVGGPKVLILHANGTNRDRDAALACELAGGRPEIVHINQLMAGEKRVDDYGMLIVPGGFSYGDDLGAGVLWSADLRHRLGDALQGFVASGRPVLGICNGFQVLVKSGLFGNVNEPSDKRKFTLTYNQSAHFECRWVTLENNPASKSVFTQGMTEPIYCPVAHGEGRFVTFDDATTGYLQDNNLIALSYVGDGAAGAVEYPANPNGSTLGIAGISNEAGNMLGLMPHPEDHIFPWQHPRFHRGEGGLSGLVLFENGIKYASR